ncbi:NAD-dependent succinate-semialdehyde dehydrogenase [Roseovarius sp. PS-C2]|uniref:NAD-dependent succinate-semialdehyde dehydrogenase n=1 Tax=Roseobacteraceae TaxID=2854170 RepID=UPI001C0DAB8D|nr:NAD-dependent succinate-semialdehyde dehydrogenase [Roseovarius sp. PS-C2]MBU3261892.1 NAD-dependent succinate-semialdehyde dehydrogenase [Roseovarius sp. PS-C2]|tara:strand:+ start:557 stop:1987 length:1431 start_codon:yes stop_codon:yes gene_type:complete
MLTDTKLFINGVWRPASDEARAPVHNPATGEVIGQHAMATKADLEEAVQAAETAFATWREVSAMERGAILRRAATALRDRMPEVARVLTLEMGKPLAEAENELRTAADLLDWFAEEARRIYGRVIPARSPDVMQLALKQPIGPVAAFTPWNFPFSQLVRKVAPALAAGCTMVAKPPEDTPASPAILAEILTEAGLPAGVLNFVYGNPPDVANYLIPHPAIRKVSFTGSVPVGKLLASLAGQHMKRITMELGGHSPVLVFEDADIEAAARDIAAFKFRNAGQVCISPTRILVQRGVYDRFVAALKAEVVSITPGAGIDPATRMGPLVSKRRVEAVTEIISEAVSAGAKLVTGGERVDHPGFFYRPTLLENVPQSARIMNEEPFGPVALLAAFDTVDEAVTEANRLAYGLAAYAFTTSIRTSQILQNKIETGMLAINHTALGLPELPLGGIKDSGFGSEGGPEAIESYVYTKLVTQKS